MFIFNQKCVYTARSIFRNFIDRNDVEVKWFKLMDYQDDPYEPWPNPDGMPTEEDWTKLIQGYEYMDRRERWVARLYASEFFSEYDLEDLRKFVERWFKTDIQVQEVPLPLRFKDLKTRDGHTPYLFVSNPGNTISLEPLCYETPEDEDFDPCLLDCRGYINFDDTMLVKEPSKLQSQLRKYMRRLRN